MNKIISLVIGLAFCILTSCVYGAPGCMDNSLHGLRNDSKNFRYVQCNCPCEKDYKLIPRRAKCVKCQHYRKPQRMIIVTPEKQTEHTTVVARNYNPKYNELRTLFSGLGYTN